MVAIACLACGDDYILVRGSISENPDDYGWVELPDTFEVGIPATVNVYTTGGGCDHAGPTLIHVTGLLAVIEPYDSGPAPGVSRACPDMLRYFLHAAYIEFPEPGDATIRVIGIGHAARDRLMTYDTTAVVR